MQSTEVVFFLPILLLATFFHFFHQFSLKSLKFTWLLLLQLLFRWKCILGEDVVELVVEHIICIFNFSCTVKLLITCLRFDMSSRYFVILSLFSLLRQNDNRFIQVLQNCLELSFVFNSFLQIKEQFIYYLIILAKNYHHEPKYEHHTETQFTKF